MRLFSDACIYRVTEVAVAEWGHDLQPARDVGLADAANGDILGHAITHGRVLLTRDMHFSNILLYPPGTHQGIVVLKIHPAWLTQVHAVLRQFLGATPEENISGALAIVDRAKWRIRRT